MPTNPHQDEPTPTQQLGEIPKIRLVFAFAQEFLYYTTRIHTFTRPPTLSNCTCRMTRADPLRACLGFKIKIFSYLTLGLWI